MVLPKHRLSSNEFDNSLDNHIWFDKIHTICQFVAETKKKYYRQTHKSDICAEFVDFSPITLDHSSNLVGKLFAFKVSGNLHGFQQNFKDFSLYCKLHTLWLYVNFPWISLNIIEFIVIFSGLYNTCVTAALFEYTHTKIPIQSSNETHIVVSFSVDFRWKLK